MLRPYKIARRHARGDYSLAFLFATFARLKRIVR
jgi:hypothetical protein